MGRPRKWASEAERLRAYRARKKSGVLPPSVAPAVEAPPSPEPSAKEAVIADLRRRTEQLLERPSAPTPVSVASSSAPAPVFVAGCQTHGRNWGSAFDGGPLVCRECGEEWEYA